MDRRNLILTSEANENKGSILGPFSLNLVKLIHLKSNFSTLRIFFKKMGHSRPLFSQFSSFQQLTVIKRL